VWYSVSGTTISLDGGNIYNPMTNVCQKKRFYNYTNPHAQVLPTPTMHFSLFSISLLFITPTLSSPLLHPRACTGPNVNAATISLIKSFEGFVASPAPDPIGLPTVGYGHLCQTSGCAEVPYAFPLTESTASALLAADLKVR
jgi:hypothetical protein